MDPNSFVAEVYRRMALRSAAEGKITLSAPPAPAKVAAAIIEYRSVLPHDLDSAILDLGYGNGWFLSACHSLGYRNIAGADFRIDGRPFLDEFGVKRYRIETDMAELLRSHVEEFDFIHMSHVIEHIPKYSLLWIVDSVYRALKKGGTLYLRTPNMEGPMPNSSYYVTLGHEYGFTSSNLASLLSICGFDDVQFIPPDAPATAKQQLGRIARWPFLKASALKHRLFGVGQGGQFGPELIATAKRNDFPPFFDEKYR